MFVIYLAEIEASSSSRVGGRADDMTEFWVINPLGWRTHDRDCFRAFQEVYEMDAQATMAKKCSPVPYAYILRTNKWVLNAFGILGVYSKSFRENLILDFIDPLYKSCFN